VAIRPLRVDELAAILTFDPDAIEGEVPTLDADSRSEDQEQELLSACPSLITIVDKPRFASRPIFAFFGEGIPYIGSSFHLE
jgi:hypothetical protein